MPRTVVRVYRRVVLRLGPVQLEALRLEREEEAKGHPFDVLTDYAERFRETPDAVVEVVELDDKGEEREAAAYTAAEKLPLLFPRPARLRRVYIIDEAAASSNAPQPLERLPSYAPSGEYYVYAGRVAVEGGGYAVLLETDMGSRLVLLQARAGVKRDSNSSRAPQHR